MTVVPTPCSHEWRLLEVEFEDGRSVQVFGCSGCEQQRLSH